MADYQVQQKVSGIIERKVIEPIFEVSNDNIQEEEEKPINDPLITSSNKREILYNLINSVLAGGLVLLGSFTATQDITLKSLVLAGVAGTIAAIVQFKAYWENEKSEYCKPKTLFSFF